VMSDPKRFLPVVYDPTVAEACIKFGHIYRRAQACICPSSTAAG